MRMVPSTGVHEPHSEFWLVAQRMLAGLGRSKRSASSRARRPTSIREASRLRSRRFTITSAQCCSSALESVWGIESRTTPFRSTAWIVLRRRVLRMTSTCMAPSNQAGVTRTRNALRGLAVGWSEPHAAGVGLAVAEGAVDRVDEGLAPGVHAEAAALLVHRVAEREAGLGIGEAHRAAHADVTEGLVGEQHAVLDAAVGEAHVVDGLHEPERPAGGIEDGCVDGDGRRHPAGLGEGGFVDEITAAE